MKTKNISKLNGFRPCIALLALSVMSTHAATLQVDLGRSTDPSLQSGWTAWNTNFGGSAINEQNSFSYAEGTAGTVDVTMTSFGSTYTRNYNTVTGDQASLSPLLRDIVFFNSASTGSFIQMQIDSLKSGSYTFTGYHHFVQENTGFPTMDILLNGTDTGQDITTLQVSSPYEINTLRTSTVNFTVANDNDSVTIRYANPTTTGSNQHFALNGFELTQIPEPSAALLGGLGVLALLRRRRQ